MVRLTAGSAGRASTRRSFSALDRRRARADARTSAVPRPSSSAGGSRPSDSPCDSVVEAWASRRIGAESQRAPMAAPTPMLAMLLLVGMLLGPNLGAQLAVLTPLCSVPLVFAGLALMHGLVAQGRLPRFWLVGLYVTLVLFMQLIYPLLAVLAIVDSLFDFRGRAAGKNGAGPANGEG